MVHCGTYLRRMNQTREEKVIWKLPVLKDLKEVRTFWAMTGFCWKIIKDFAKAEKPYFESEQKNRMNEGDREPFALHYPRERM